MSEDYTPELHDIIRGTVRFARGIGERQAVVTSVRRHRIDETVFVSVVGRYVTDAGELSKQERVIQPPWTLIRRGSP